MLTTLSNGQDIQCLLVVLQTLVPARGPGRFMGQFLAPVQTKYQSAPLVDISDLASTDSKQAWQFRTHIAYFLTTKDAVQKTLIMQQLQQWKDAALQILSLVKAAPHLKALNTYATKVVRAADIGLQALEKAPDENEKAPLLQT